MHKSPNMEIHSYNCIPPKMKCFLLLLFVLKQKLYFILLKYMYMELKIYRCYHIIMNLIKTKLLIDIKVYNSKKKTRWYITI